MSFSKTEIYCDCSVLQRAADEPDSPVRFDPEMNDYYISDINGEGQTAIRHCFFCGGKAPKSRRESLFAYMSEGETSRLIELTRPLKTLSAVLSAFGKPDQDWEVGGTTTTPERDGQPSETRPYRALVYETLSATVDVQVMVYSLDQIRFSFHGKLLRLQIAPATGPA